MIAAWRRLDDAETDHEVIWSAVGIFSAVVGTIWIKRLGLPPVICPFHAITGLPCLTCGATRAFAALVAGDLAASLRSNPIVVAAAAASSLYVPYALSVAGFGLPRLRVRLSAHEQTAVRWLIGALAVALWIYLVADGR